MCASKWNLKGWNRVEESNIFDTYISDTRNKRRNKQVPTQSGKVENWSAARFGEWFPETTYLSLLRKNLRQHKCEWKEKEDRMAGWAELQAE